MIMNNRIMRPFIRAVRSVLALLPMTATTCCVVGCGDNPTDPPPIVIPGPGEAIVYSRHIEPIWITSCSGSQCHVGGKGAGLAMDSWNQLMEGSDNAGMVVPFAAHRSHLFQHINTDTTLGPIAEPRMPISRDPLPLEQLLLIKRWIDEGAKNDNGDITLNDADRPRLFVTCQSEDLVAVIDLETEHVVRYISVGERPNETSPPEAAHNIILSTDGNSFFVNLIAAGLVEKYDARTFTKLGSVQVGLSPAQIRITDDGSTLYVSNFDLTFQQQFISRIDAASMGSATNIDIEGYAPHGITIDPNGELLYTMNAGSDDISVVNMTSNEVIAHIPIIPGTPSAAAGSAVHEPYQGEIGADGHLYVTCRKSGQVRVVDLANRRVIDSIVVGKRPLIGAMTPDRSGFWVPNQGDNTVSIVDIASRSLVATITDFENQPHAVAFTSDGARAYVTCENQQGDASHHHALTGADVIPGIVYSVDVGTRTIGRDISVAGFAAGIVARQ